MQSCADAKCGHVGVINLGLKIEEGGKHSRAIFWSLEVEIKETVLNFCKLSKVLIFLFLSKGLGRRF
nr:hypothetical protein CFP56_03532 [Quercus suber]